MRDVLIGTGLVVALAACEREGTSTYESPTTSPKPAGEPQTGSSGGGTGSSMTGTGSTGTGSTIGTAGPLTPVTSGPVGDTTSPRPVGETMPGMVHSGDTGRAVGTTGSGTATGTASGTVGTTGAGAGSGTMGTGTTGTTGTMGTGTTGTLGAPRSSMTPGTGTPGGTTPGTLGTNAPGTGTGTVGTLGTGSTTGSTASGTSGTAGMSSAALTRDADRTARVRRAIMAENSLSDAARRIEITTTNGVVTVFGQVATETERRLIIRRATQVAGQGKVRDALAVTIQPPPPAATTTPSPAPTPTPNP